MNNDPLIYIILRNHNSFDLTDNCISSLLGISYSNFKICLVDDGSKDNSGKLIDDKYESVEVLFSKKYIEYCKGLNLGAKHALANNADYIFFVNNDTNNFSINILEEMLSLFINNDGLGKVGCSVFDFDGAARFDWSKVDSILRLGIEINTPTEGYMISRDALLAVGLLDEYLVRYFEDYDFILRLRKKGYQTLSTSKVSFDHLGGGTSSKQIFTPNFYRVRNLIWFIKRYKKDEPFLWKAKQFKGFMKKHYEVLKVSILRFQLIRFLGILFSVLLGLLAGLFLKWKYQTDG